MDNKQKLMDILTNEVWQHSPKMVDYCMKKTAYIIPLDNEDIATIDKPDIETSFCFPYGYCGVSTDDDYREAAKAQEYARTNESYFISENLKPLNDMLEELNNTDNTLYKFVAYNSSPETSNLKNFMILKKWDKPEGFRYANYKALEECTDNEREEIIKGYVEVRAKFIKRLHTYLKRYGLSKLHTWTYLSD